MLLPKRCRHCNKEYFVKPSVFNKTSYCSKSCMAHDYKTRLKGKANPRFSDADKRICEQCGKEYRNYNKTRRFCSPECYVASGIPTENVQKATLAIRGNGKGRRCVCNSCNKIFYHPKHQVFICPECKEKGIHFVRKESRGKRQCVICGKEFKRYNKTKTCGKECLSRLRALIQLGEKSHRWQGGKTKEAMLFRGSIDYAIWRRRVYERDNYTCQLCGVRGGKLCVHHIKRFALDRSLALVVANGITLCWKCHTSIRHKESLYESQFYKITGGVHHIQLTFGFNLER